MLQSGRMPDPPFRRVEIPLGLDPSDQIDSEPDILRRLLGQFDAREISRQLADSKVYWHDDQVHGDQVLHRLMRCIQTSDLDFRDRSLNEIIMLALTS
jgi:hypothetical protein